MSERTNILRNIFDYMTLRRASRRNKRRIRTTGCLWNEPERAQAPGKERSALEAVVETIDQLDQGVEDVEGLLELAVEEEDQETFDEIEPRTSRAWS